MVAMIGLGSLEDDQGTREHNGGQQASRRGLGALRMNGLFERSTAARTFVYPTDGALDANTAGRRAGGQHAAAAVGAAFRQGGQIDEGADGDLVFSAACQTAEFDDKDASCGHRHSSGLAWSTSQCNSTRMARIVARSSLAKCSGLRLRRMSANSCSVRVRSLGLEMWSLPLRLAHRVPQRSNASARLERWRH